MLKHEIIIEGTVVGDPIHVVEEVPGNKEATFAVFDLVVPHKNMGDGLKDSDIIRCMAPEEFAAFVDENIKAGAHVKLSGRFDANTYQNTADDLFSENHILVDAFLPTDASTAAEYANGGEIYGVLDTYPELERLEEVTDEDTPESESTITRCKLIVENNDFNENANIVVYAHIPCVAYGDLAERIDNELIEGSEIKAAGHIQHRVVMGSDGQPLYCPEFVITSYELVSLSAEQKPGEDDPAETFV